MNKKERAFVEMLWGWYRAQGRHGLPWRHTHDPYAILVSEVMLQQTQVERVIPKYTAFIARFPAVSKLAEAPLADVLILWQGLGYNRRAKYLHECAKSIVREYGGKFPKSEVELRSLPGVGAYTAGAVGAFAFDEGVPIIETNIRTVFIHHFFNNRDVVSDAEVLQIVKRTLPNEQMHK